MDPPLLEAAASLAGCVHRRSLSLQSPVAAVGWAVCSSLGTGAELCSWSTPACQSCILSSDRTPAEPRLCH